MIVEKILTFQQTSNCEFNKFYNNPKCCISMEKVKEHEESWYLQKCEDFINSLISNTKLHHFSQIQNNLFLSVDPPGDAMFSYRPAIVAISTTDR